MRRYGKTSDATVVPGKDAGIKLVLQPLAEAAEQSEIAPCQPIVDGLFWFSDSTGEFDQVAEAAYLLAEGAAGPLLGIAKLAGEPCDLPVTWAKAWTPATGTGGDPGYLEDGARLIVYPLAGTAPGTLEVTAEHGVQSYGPIMLIVTLYECPSGAILAWFDAAKAFVGDGESASGIVWAIDGKPIAPQSGVSSVALTINGGYELPQNSFRVRLYLDPIPPLGGFEVPPAWTLSFSANGGEDSYDFSRTGAATIVFTVAPSVTTLLLHFPNRDWTTANIYLYFEMLGPAGEAWTPPSGE